MLIVRWTRANFGDRRAAAYDATLKALISTFSTGPEPLGFKLRDDIGADLRTLHVRAIGHRGRHFVLYRTQGCEIQVIRLLHDSMDLARHVPPESEGNR